MGPGIVQAEARPEVEVAAVRFVRALRASGVDAPMSSVMTFVRGLVAVGLEARDTVYWVGRITLGVRPEDVPTYDAAFHAFWLGQHPEDRHEDLEPKMEQAPGPDRPFAEGATESPDATLAVRWSPRETLRHKDFASYTPRELETGKRLMADLRLGGALRRTRRLRRSTRGHGRPDIRAMVRRALRTGGEPLGRVYQEPRMKPRRIVFLCDVSGSMEPYVRALLHFVHAAASSRRTIEAFTFGTRLTRITRQLRSRDADAAMAAVGETVRDWSGGTRLGDALHEFNTRWGLRGMARGAVVVILSDGWDRGDPEDVTAQMERLQRVAHKIVWANPLKVTPGYAPRAAGMAAALPYIDEFIEGHSLAALEHLARVVAGSRARLPEEMQ